jgi:hypothetical protein
MHDIAILVFLILGSLYLKHRGEIHNKMEDPLFVMFFVGISAVICILYFLLGHYCEKLFNKINMRRQGIKPSTQIKPLSFPFIEFDLKKCLEVFYKNPKNQSCTFLGLNAEKKNGEVVSIPDIQRCQHLQLLGMTGTGKTEGIFMPLIYQDALKKRPVIILDAKGEMSAINQLNAILTSIGRGDDFLLFSLAHKEISCTYNPLYVGECDPQVVIDAFFNNFKTDNQFYRETAKTIFTNVFYILHSLGKPFTPMDVYTYLTDIRCRQDINKQVEILSGKGPLYLKLLTTMLSKLTDQYKGWEHVVTGFNNYLLDHRDDILNEDDSDIVLTDAIRERKVVYFQLPTNAYPIQAVSIARMVQANLRYISSLIQTGKMPKDILVSIIIDEYASFAEESFVEVLNKARSSGMMVTLAHQSLSDLSAISDSFMRRIDENTLNKIYLKQTDPQLCELIAKSMGTYTKEEKTYRMAGGRFGNQVHMGDSSNKIVNEFHFPPDKVKKLHKFGQGYYIYRGENFEKCVNFGVFDKITEKPYIKKIKPNKQRGLRLFEEYYLNSSNSEEKKKAKQSSQAGKKLVGAIEFDE